MRPRTVYDERRSPFLRLSFTYFTLGGSVSMLFHQWTEFVVYPLDAGRVRSCAERLNTKDAFRVDAAGHYPSDYEPSSPRGAVVSLFTICQPGDAFESMLVEDSGYIVIWTRQKVWFLAREGTQGQVEKLRYLPRHPPSAKPEA